MTYAYRTTGDPDPRTKQNDLRGKLYPEFVLLEGVLERQVRTIRVYNTRVINSVCCGMVFWSDFGGSQGVRG